MITEGSTKNPVELGEAIWGLRLKEVHWGGKPPMIIITGQDQPDDPFATLVGSRRSVPVFTNTAWFVVSFSSDTGGNPIWATIKCTGVFANDVNLISIDPVLPTTSEFTGYVPEDADWVPLEAKDPGFAKDSRVVGYDFTKPITLVPTQLKTVQITKLGTSVQRVVDSVFGAQATTIFTRDIVTSQDIDFQEGSFHAGDTIPAGTYHDVGFRTKDDLTAEVSGYPKTEITVTVYKGGTFLVDHTFGRVGPKGTVTVFRGTVLANEARTYPVFAVGNLAGFNSGGFAP